MKCARYEITGTLTQGIFRRMLKHTSRCRAKVGHSKDKDLIAKVNCDVLEAMLQAESAHPRVCEVTAGRVPKKLVPLVASDMEPRAKSRLMQR